VHRNGDDWKAPGMAVPFISQQIKRTVVLTELVCLNGYGSTPLTPCEMKMNEAVQQLRRRGRWCAFVTHNLGETIGAVTG